VTLFKLQPLLLIVFFISLVISVSSVEAQEIDNVDSAFQEARALAFDGNRSEARSLAYAILEISPDYHDVRILIARTYSWDGKYMDARRELDYVLKKQPNHRDALSAAIDNEIWSENPDRAVEIAKNATRFYPTDEPLNLKRAEAHIANNEEREANRILNLIADINPSSSEAQTLRKSLLTSGQKYTLTLSYTGDRFSEIFDPQHKSYVQLSRRTPYGSIIGRVNYSHRFETNGIQPEIDFYPSLIDGWYGYLNFGYTTSSIYPQYRAGAELYKNFPKGFEASAGFRYLNFERGSVTIYTGSLSKYWRSWFFTLRPYFTPNDAGTSRSINASARYYFDGAENYVTLRGGLGFSPEERRFQDVDGDVFIVRSDFVGIDFLKTLRYNLGVFGSFDLANQEFTFDPGNFNRIYTMNAGVQFKF